MTVLSRAGHVLHMTELEELGEKILLEPHHEIYYKNVYFIKYFFRENMKQSIFLTTLRDSHFL